jgi:hypothetical protein
MVPNQSPAIAGGLALLPPPHAKTAEAQSAA